MQYRIGVGKEACLKAVAGNMFLNTGESYIALETNTGKRVKQQNQLGW